LAYIRQYIVFLSIWCLSTTCKASHFDTLNSSLQIYLNDSAPSFTIPFHSINTEHGNTIYTTSYGSHSFKRKSQLNKTAVQVVKLTRTSITFVDGESELTFVLTSSSGKPVISINSTGQGEWQFSFSTDRSETFYGGGTRFDSAVLNASTYKNVAEENGIGRGDKPISNWTSMLGIQGERNASYYPVPFFFSSRKRGFFIHTKQLFFADFHSDEVGIKLYGNQTEVFLFESSTYLDLISQFSAINGRGTPYPSWALGTILGVQGGTENVLAKLEKLRTEGAMIDALWIQDWVGKRKTNFGSRLNWTWELDTTHYESIASLKVRTGLPVLGYINPFFTRESAYAKIGLEKGYLLQNSDHKFGCFDFGGIEGYMLDLFQEPARNWMKEIIQRNLIENGFDGWMADFGEWLSAENMLQGEDDHNQYLQLWIQLNQEIIAENSNELFFFHRSGVSGTAQFSQLTWFGDQTTDYGIQDGLPSVITAMQSSGLTGLPPGHSDIGGYTALNMPFVPKILRTEDVLLDWMRLEAMTPVFRTHEGILPENILQVYSSDTMAKAFAYFSRIHNALQPYFENCLQEYRRAGIPVYRHPVLLNKTSFSEHEVFVGNDICLIYSENVIENMNGFVKLSVGENRLYVFIRENSTAHQFLTQYLPIK
jgi:alpha-glucosidase